LQLEGQGIASLAAFLETFGYRDAGDELDFPKKKLRARWMRMWPPRADLPRVFISELKAGARAGPHLWCRAGALLACMSEGSLLVLLALLVAAAQGARVATMHGAPFQGWGACRDTPCLYHADMHACCMHLGPVHQKKARLLRWWQVGSLSGGMASHLKWLEIIHAAQAAANLKAGLPPVGMPALCGPYTCGMCTSSKERGCCAGGVAIGGRAGSVWSSSLYLGT